MYIIYKKKRMSLGIQLSQLITQQRPISSGISELDEKLSNNGFIEGCIYEIYGPPGVGKNKFIKDIIDRYREKENEQEDNNILWIESYNFNDDIDEIDSIRINRLSELIYYFQKEIESNSKKMYKIIIIDRFSQIISDYLSNLQKCQVNNIHQLKCKYLTIILTLITRYVIKNKSVCILLNDCINTGYVNHNEMHYQKLDNSMFLIENGNSNNNNTQVLKSSLLGSIGFGGEDYKWLKFIKERIGIYYGWEDEGKKRCRVIIIGEEDELGKVIRIRINKVTDQFELVHTKDEKGKDHNNTVNSNTFKDNNNNNNNKNINQKKNNPSDIENEGNPKRVKLSNTLVEDNGEHQEDVVYDSEE